jgi:predicted transcriptional regulator
MKTLTITISDEAAEALSKAVAGGKHTAEQIASHVVEAAYAPDWADFDEQDIAAIEEGLADLEAGRVIPHEEVIAEVRKKYGW